jgi:hypothetical protein
VIFEHVSHPSHDDLCVPIISQNASQGQLVMDPGRWDVHPLFQEPPQLACDRHASLPMMASVCPLPSDTSGSTQDISRCLELQQYEERFETLLVLHQNVLSCLTDLPDSMATIIKAAQVAQAKLLTRAVTKKDFKEVCSMMATLQAQQVHTPCEPGTDQCCAMDQPCGGGQLRDACHRTRT